VRVRLDVAAHDVARGPSATESFSLGERAAPNIMSFDLKKVIAQDANRHHARTKHNRERAAVSGADKKTADAHLHRERGDEAKRHKHVKDDTEALPDATSYVDRAAERRQHEGNAADDAAGTAGTAKKGLDFDLLRRTRELGELPTPVEVLLAPPQAAPAAAVSSKPDRMEMARRLTALVTPAPPMVYVFNVMDETSEPVEVSTSIVPTRLPMVVVSKADAAAVSRAVRKASARQAAAAAAAATADESEDDLFEGAGSYTGAAEDVLDAQRHALENAVVVVAPSSLSSASSSSSSSDDEGGDVKGFAKGDDVANEDFVEDFLALDVEALMQFRQRVLQAIALAQG